MTKGLVILGFGGHARSIADVAFSLGIRDFIFVDENARPNETFLGYPVRQALAGVLEPEWLCMPAAGDNRARALQMDAARSNGWPLASLIAPTASIGIASDIGEGVLVAHHAHIGPAVHINDGCVINTSAVVDHESVVGAYSHVSIKSAVAGRCRIGKFVFLGAGSTVIDGLEVVDHVVLGAGAVAIHSLDQAGTYVGVPARQVIHK